MFSENKKNKSGVSAFKSFGKKLLSAKTFSNDTIPKRSEPVKKPNPLKKRATLAVDSNIRSPSLSIKIPNKNESVRATRSGSISDRKPLVYNPYGMNTPNFSQNTTSNYSGSYQSNSGISSTNGNNGAKDPTFYLHEGSQHIRVLQLPVANPNDFLPDKFKQLSVQLLDNFKFESDHKIIGTGGSAEVKTILTKTKKPKVYAYKKLNMIYQETDEQYYKRCSKEFIIGKHLVTAKGLGSINIIGLYQLCKVPTTSAMVRGWGYVMELGHFDLFHLMSRLGWKNVDSNEKYCIFKQVAMGINFMHKNGIAHRDLKPENVLICNDGVCKITDFGISAWGHIEPDDYSSPVKMCAGMIGSPPYAPPEVMMWDSKKKYAKNLKKEFDPFLIDCFSLGIILMTLLNNTIPFIESCSKDSKFRDFELSYDKFIEYNNKFFRQSGNYKPGPGQEYTFAKFFKDTEVSRVAWRLSDPKAETRYTMDDLFKDPWFNKIELCVDPHDEEKYSFVEPVLLPSSDINNTSTSVTSGNDGILSDEHNVSSGTSNSFVSRSMIDIATTPNLNKLTKSSGFSSSARSNSTSLSNDDNNISKIYGSNLNTRSNSNQSNHSSCSDHSSHSNPNEEHSLGPMSGSTLLNKKDTNLFTLKEEEPDENDVNKENIVSSELNNDNVEDKENLEEFSTKTDEIESEKIIPELTNKISQLSTQINATNTISNKINDTHTIKRSNTGKRIKKIIHHHLNVTNSVNNTSTSYSNSMSSIASGGSASFRKW